MAPYLRVRPLLAPLLRQARSSRPQRPSFAGRRASTSTTPAIAAAGPAAPTTATAPRPVVSPPVSAAPTPVASPSSSSGSSYSSSSSSTSGFPLSTYIYAAALGATVFATYYYATDTRASAHRYIVPPLLRLVFPDAEDAHHYGTASLKLLHRLGLNPRDRTDTPEAIAATQVTVFDGEYTVSNPIGISAGLDKDADIPDALFDLGAAVVEVGGCTPRPQAGNPKPRVFRVPSVEGMVNRYGLNSIGADAVAARLRSRLRAFARAHGLTEADVLSGAAGVPVGSLRPGKLLAVQVAKNKDTDEHDVRAVAEDYAYCVRRLAPYADVLVVNVSSPNTPGLRDLQAVEPLTRILEAVVDEARKTAAASATSKAGGLLLPVRARPPRVMVKVSPDEDEDAQIDGICEAVWASGVDGIIVGNTTKRRAGIVPAKLALRTAEKRNLGETGGFSGPAMYDRTLALVARYRKRLDEQALKIGEGGGSEGGSSSKVTPKTLMASGGVTNGDQALRLLNAGASVAFVYTGLVYGGAGTVTRIKQELRELVQAKA